MGLYNFKPQFVPFIRARTKKHTIRETRKYPDEPGDPMYLYTGLRTKKREMISIEECLKVEPIRIECEYPDAEVILPWDVSVFVGDIELTPHEKECLARADGFNDFAEMIRFWNGRLPFEGHIIHWK